MGRNLRAQLTIRKKVNTGKKTYKNFQLQRVRASGQKTSLTINLNALIHDDCFVSHKPIQGFRVGTYFSDKMVPVPEIFWLSDHDPQCEQTPDCHRQFCPCRHRHSNSGFCAILGEGEGGAVKGKKLLQVSDSREGNGNRSEANGECWQMRE